MGYRPNKLRVSHGQAAPYGVSPSPLRLRSGQALTLPPGANHDPQIFNTLWDAALRPPMNRRATAQRPINRTGGIRRKPDSSGAVLDSSATSSPSEKMWVKTSTRGEGTNRKTRVTVVNWHVSETS